VWKLELVYCTSQVCGSTTLSPRAPALAHDLTSSLMFAVRVLTDGRPLLKTQSFRCFQAIQGTSKVVEARALRSALGVFPRVCMCNDNCAGKICVASWDQSRAGLCGSGSPTCGICVSTVCAPSGNL
jgi:hypothetical protein